MKTFNFIIESNSRWYVVLPEWTGPKEDLEMVMGADVLLDMIAQGDGKVQVMMSESEFKGFEFELTFVKEEFGGATYDLKSKLDENEFQIWLCHVNKFIFGLHPKKIYLK